MIAFLPLFSSKTTNTPVVNDEKNKLSSSQKAEQLYNDNSYSRELLLDFLKKANDETPNDVEVLWRLSRAAYDCAEKVGISNEKKKELIYYAYEVFQKALKVNEENLAVHKW